MKRNAHIRLSFALCICALVFPALLSAADKAKTAKSEPGKTEKKGTAKPEPIQAKSPKKEMEFWYYVPSSYDGKKPVPFILSYHGASGTGKGEIGSWTQAAEEKGFIVACPTSTLAGAGQKAGVPRGVTPQEYADEEEAALSILDMMRSQFRIDRRRVMITGFSGGGNPTYWLGFLHPEAFPFVCPRCGNFPGFLERVQNADEKAKAAVAEASKKSRVYVFWGEKDHPIILGEIDHTLAWIESLKPENFTKKKIDGMGHESRPAEAISWFFEKTKEAEKEWEKEDSGVYKKQIEDGKAALEKGDKASAFSAFEGAAAIEALYPGFGKSAESEMKKIEEEAKKLLNKAKTRLGPVGKNKEEAKKFLQELLDGYKGTASAKEGEKLLGELEQGDERSRE